MMSTIGSNLPTPPPPDDVRTSRHAAGEGPGHRGIPDRGQAASDSSGCFGISAPRRDAITDRRRGVERWSSTARGESPVSIEGPQRELPVPKQHDLVASSREHEVSHQSEKVGEAAGTILPRRGCRGDHALHQQGFAFDPRRPPIPSGSRWCTSYCVQQSSLLAVISLRIRIGIGKFILIRPFRELDTMEAGNLARVPILGDASLTNTYTAVRAGNMSNEVERIHHSPPLPVGWSAAACLNMANHAVPTHSPPLNAVSPSAR
ncbi:hypothetical protein MLGJGCBP_03403 [Rhodococcus sp. T7]|nr:hypothetical protein MLGJGCBP_03403 [Rhodococcus sp. T7]